MSLNNKAKSNTVYTRDTSKPKKFRKSKSKNVDKDVPKAKRN